MPRRASPCHREAVESILATARLPEPTLRGALELMRELADLFDWRVSPLAAGFEHCAVVLRAAELVTEGLSEKDALDAASIQLGVAVETTRSRGRRWPSESRSLCTPTGRAAARRLEQQPQSEGTQ